MKIKPFRRTFEPLVEIKKGSYFIFGPRGVGKSYLLRPLVQKKDIFYINLLDSSLYLRLQRNPSELLDFIQAQSAKKVIIDEIQRIPELLNLVHLMIEEKGLQFILTGSSARKLKRGQANMLAGRALTRELFPLTWNEIDSFDLKKYLLYGGLPMSQLSPEPEDFLFAYTNTYLREEIQAEGLVKKLPAFSSFLTMAALTSGEMLNFASLSKEVGVSAVTIREYYSILEDTLLGFIVEPWTKSKKRKPISTAKFYFFDTGVRNTLAEISSLNEKSNLWGQAFEQFIAMELRAFISYKMKNKLKLRYWRTTSQFEVDFILGDKIAIEVKSANKVQTQFFKGLNALKEEGIVEDYYLISNDPLSKVTQDVHCLHWQTFLKRLWSGKIIPFSTDLSQKK